MIGATTLDEYRKYIEKDAALERRFQTVFVGEPSVEDTIAILRGLKERYEVHHGVRIQDSALVASERACWGQRRAWPALFAFWNRAPSKVEPCVLLSFGRPSPNLTRFIVSPDVKDEAWCEGLPQQASPQESVSGCSPSSATQAASDRNISLRQYLDSIG
jgi:hypothetical protein